jgi:hypothetical protein
LKFIVLDLSSKTGWAHFEVGPSGLFLLNRGQLDQVPMDKNLKYPLNYISWSLRIFDKVYDEILAFNQFDAVVIEETAKGSKDAHAQKLLEWVHFHVAKFIVERNIESYYLQTGEWRQTAGCQMTKEEKKRNKRVRDVRKAAAAKGEKVVLVEIAPGQKKVGKVSKKHVTIRRVKEIFNIDLKVKENDTADALLIGYAAYQRFFKNK